MVVAAASARSQLLPGSSLTPPAHSRCSTGRASSCSGRLLQPHLPWQRAAEPGKWARRQRTVCAAAAGSESPASADEDTGALQRTAEELEQIEANYQVWLETTRVKSDQAYQELKDALLKRTQRGGTFVTLYIFLVVSSPAAFCAMIGALASYGYMLLLMLDVDNRSVKDHNMVMDAQKVESPIIKFFTKGLGAYLQALQPRLLLPVSLAAGAWWYNQTAQTPLGLVEEGCLFLGFGSYKMALLIELWECLKPKAKTREELDAVARPMLPQLEDVDDIRPDLKGEKF